MTENFPLKNLTLLERNPRKITKEQMQKLCDSIKSDPQFLYNRPVLVNLRDGKYIVYAGNQRVRAARQLKMKDIPCIIEKDLDEDLVRKRVIKDNKTYGDFDFDMLANEFDIDDLLEAGFSADELIGGKEVEDVGSTGEKEEDGNDVPCEMCGQKIKKKKKS